MTQLKFRGATFQHQLPSIEITEDEIATAKYRGSEYTRHQPILKTSTRKGLKFRGAEY